MRGECNLKKYTFISLVEDLIVEDLIVEDLNIVNRIYKNMM
jgi:hypothetical protein